MGLLMATCERLHNTELAPSAPKPLMYDLGVSTPELTQTHECVGQSTLLTHRFYDFALWAAWGGPARARGTQQIVAGILGATLAWVAKWDKQPTQSYKQHNTKRALRSGTPGRRELPPFDLCVCLVSLCRCYDVLDCWNTEFTSVAIQSLER